MYLRKIEIKNFRLWKEATIELEQGSTVIVGKNNTGKTSFIDIIQRIIKNAKISFNDYPLNERKSLYENIKNYLDETIDINLYDMFQKKLSSRIEKYKIEILELEKQCSSLEPLDVRIENAKKSIRKLLDISYNGVDEKIIEEFVEKVIVHKDYFEWKLNFMNETIKLEVDGKSRKDGFLLEHK